jgi:hypothetical protein
VYYIRDYWFSGHCPSSSIPTQHNVSENICFRWNGREATTHLGPLDTAGLNHWTSNITRHFLPARMMVRGRVSKQVTNGSKTAVTDVIDFLCVSLSSNTFQLHVSLGSRRAYACSEAGFSSQNGDSAWGFYYRRAAFCYALLVGKMTECKE